MVNGISVNGLGEVQMDSCQNLGNINLGKVADFKNLKYSVSDHPIFSYIY